VGRFKFTKFLLNLNDQIEFKLPARLPRHLIWWNLSLPLRHLLTFHLLWRYRWPTPIFLSCCLPFRKPSFFIISVADGCSVKQCVPSSFSPIFWESTLVVSGKFYCIWNCWYFSKLSRRSVLIVQSRLLEPPFRPSQEKRSHPIQVCSFAFSRSVDTKICFVDIQSINQCVHNGLIRTRWTRVNAGLHKCAKLAEAVLYRSELKAQFLDPLVKLDRPGYQLFIYFQRIKGTWASKNWATNHDSVNAIKQPA
jgi:hypothetical protein